MGSEENQLCTLWNRRTRTSCDVLKIEEDEGAEIYACKSCNGYTKVIDTRKLLKVAPPELLDLKSIHLDYVAQDKGYAMVEDGSFSLKRRV